MDITINVQLSDDALIAFVKSFNTITFHLKEEDAEELKRQGLVMPVSYFTPIPMYKLTSDGNIMRVELIKIFNLLIDNAQIR